MTVTKRITSLIIAITLCFSFAVGASAITYPDYYPNTHRNTGQNIADIIGIAKTQIGYTELNTKTGQPLSPSQDGGYTKYGAYFGNSTGAWCMYFVSWCAYKAGIPTSVVPRLGNCANAVSWYKSHNLFVYRSSGYKPKAGDMIFYNWSGGSHAQHVGIVTGVSGNNVYTIEGNTNSSYGYQCAAKTRKGSANYIIGYGVPKYNDAETYVGSYSFANYVSSSSISSSDSIIYSTSKLSIITASATEITSDNATLNGTVKNSGALRISDYGFYFGSDKKNLSKHSMGYSSTSTEIELKMSVKKDIRANIEPNKTYYYRAYARIDNKDYLGPTYALVTVSDMPEKVVLNQNELNVAVGQTAELMAAQLPAGSKNEGFKWTTTDSKIATVSKNGLVQGKDYGTVYITASAVHGSVSAKCTVDVLISSPENFEITNKNTGTISLTWSSVEDAKGYEIYRSMSGEDDSFKLFKKVDAKTTSYSDKTVKTGNRYYYKLVTVAPVDTYNSDMTSVLYSDPRLATPENVQAKSNDNGVSVSWNKVSGAKKYIIYRSDSKNGLYTAVAKTRSTFYNDESTVQGQNYYYKIIAADSNTQSLSQYSDTVAVLSKTTTGNTINSAQLKRTTINPNSFKEFI